MTVCPNATHRSPGPTRVAGLAAGILLVAGLTGCLKMDMDIAVDGDQVHGTMTVGLDRSMAGLSELEGDARAPDLSGEIMGDLEESFDGAEVSVARWEDGDYVGARATVHGMDLADFHGSGLSDGGLVIAHDPAAGTYEVTGRFDMTESGASGAGAELPPGMAESMLDDFDITVSITFPGEVLNHNGAVNGTTVTWQPQIGQENEVYALASSTRAGPLGDGTALVGHPAAGYGSTSLLTSVLVGTGVLVVAVGAVAGARILRRRRRLSAAAAEQ